MIGAILLVAFIAIAIVLLKARETRRQRSPSAQTVGTNRGQATDAASSPVLEIEVKISPLDGSLFDVPSMSIFRQDQVYSCDAAAMTCTCGDFTIFRDVFAPTDPLRLCKHLRAVLLEENAVFLSDLRATSLWEERGGRMFKWDAPNGRAVFLAMDPARDWINVAIATTRQTGETSDSYGWSISEERWAYGTSPRGLARALKPVLSRLASIRESQLSALGGEIQELWHAREMALHEAVREEEKQKGLICQICESPLGRPWGTPVGEEVACQTCGNLSLVVGEEAAEPKERALCDWKFYGDPRGSGDEALGLLEAEHRRAQRELGQLRAQYETLTMSTDVYETEERRIEQESAARSDTIKRQREVEAAAARRSVSKARALFRTQSKEG